MNNILMRINVFPAPSFDHLVKYAKILYQLSGIECWFQYMICNTEQSFHLENNLFILNEILKCNFLFDGVIQ